MAGAMKLIFVAVAVICYMQVVEMSRLPRDSPPAGDTTASDILDTISKNVNDLFNEENLKKIGLDKNQVQDALSKAGETVQHGVNDLLKNLENVIKSKPKVDAAEGGSK